MGPKAITPLEAWYKSIRSPHGRLFIKKRKLPERKSEGPRDNFNHADHTGQ